MVRVTKLLSPCASAAVSVITCVPTDKALVENDVPRPMVPFTLLVQVSALPDSAPSSGSVPVPLNVSVVPATTDAPDAGDEIEADGALFTTVTGSTVTTTEAHDIFPLLSITRRAMEWLPTLSLLVESDTPYP